VCSSIREKIGQLAAESHTKAVNAAKKKLFDSEIVPISINLTSKDGKKLQRQ
jgi:acetyl-CoA acetyltransferase